MKLLVVVLVSVLARGLCLARGPGPHEPLYTLPKVVNSEHWGENLTTPELIEAFGYPVEIHHVTTEDGYILELHRIPYGLSGPSSDRPPVYLQHGLVSSSADWIMNSADEALGYILADAGYDVWLGNVRGNTYSRFHVELSPDDDLEFWSFSWNEMGIYDIPASIDYVLEATGTTSLNYVGFSMGTTVFMVMLSERPEYNDKVKVAALMAPIAYLGDAKGALAELAPISHDLDLIFSLLGVGEFLPHSDLMEYFGNTYCDTESDTADVCYNFLFLICGPDPAELNKEWLPSLISHTPAGTSVHTVNHYAQLILSGNFSKYDYGLIGNLNHYGQQEPPLYDLTHITAPVGLFWSDNDWLAVPTGVARVADELPNVVFNYEVALPEWSHLDFAWAIHANEYVYTHILELFSKY
ncbi:lipase 3 [Procambarus clarkii]|uniref:lipase 3 n=1 Tax=Procambarus clarkii TaxID=6728 RepID=UPI001E6788CE|nr:lipase 3-like [Procambarus clarkii]XP_045597723.1 lipase 3-like [Procambarus clarkii]